MEIPVTAGPEVYKKRPFISRSSEFGLPDTTYSIEYFQACKDQYRICIGAAGLIVPFQVGPRRFQTYRRPATDAAYALFDNPINFSINSSNHEEYERILARHNLTLLYNAQIQMLSHAHDPETTAIDTLILSIDSPADFAQCKSAAHEIYALFSEKAKKSGIEYNVEIRNNRRWISDTSVSFVDDDIAAAVELVQAAVEKQAKQSIPEEMLCTIVPVMRRPRHFPEVPSRPVFLVGVTGRAVHGWETAGNTIISRIKEVLEENGIKDIYIDVEIHAAVLGGASRGNVNRHIGGTTPCRIPAPVSGSIGPKSGSNDISGTLGLWVYFDKPGCARKFCFLTCYHVVRGGVADEKEREVIDEEGLGLKGKKSPRGEIAMVHPSVKDTVELKRQIERGLAKKDSRREAYEEAVEQQRNLEWYATQGGIGKVVCASGYKKIANNAQRGLDWALVEVHDTSMFGLNDQIPYGKSWNEELTPRGDGLMPEYQRRNVISTVAANLPENRKWLVKPRSRTCGTRLTETSGIRGLMMHDRPAFASHVLLAKIDDHNHVRVAEPGDSGAVVINEHGEWVGMIVGMEAYGGTTFMTGAREIMDHIDEETGGRISLPREN